MHFGLGKLRKLGKHNNYTMSLAKRKAEDAIEAYKDHITLTPLTHLNHHKNAETLDYDWSVKYALEHSAKYRAYVAEFKGNCCVLVQGKRCGKPTAADALYSKCTCKKRPTFLNLYQPTVCDTHYGRKGCRGVHATLTKRLDSCILDMKEEFDEMVRVWLEESRQDRIEWKASDMRRFLEQYDNSATKIRRLLADYDR